MTTESQNGGQEGCCNDNITSNSEHQRETKSAVMHWGMSGLLSGVYLGHHLGHVWDNIWGILSTIWTTIHGATGICDAVLLELNSQ